MFDRNNVQDLYELSPLQKGMLFHYLKDNDSSAYFEQMALELSGNVDVNVLEKSVNSLLEKYEVLRTNFLYSNVKEPLQFVWKEKRITIEVIDISGLSSNEQKQFITSFRKEDREKGFDLSRDPLIRFSLIMKGAERYVLVWSHHHILIDGWCFGILFKELLGMYQMHLHHNIVPHQNATPYSEYIKWLKNQSRTKAATYWSDYLSGYDQLTSLSDLKGNPQKNQYDRQESALELSIELSHKLKLFSKRAKVTLNSVVQSLWGTVLQLRLDTSDVAFGTVVSGRPSSIPGVEDMVGLFINTVPLRVQREKGMSFENLVIKVHEETQLSASYEYASLSDIQKNTIATGPIFDHIVVFENYPLDPDIMDLSKASGFSIEGLDVYEQTNYDAHVLVMPEETISFKVSFNGQMYNKHTIDGFLSQLEYIVEQVTRKPDIQIESLQILREEEEQGILKLGYMTAPYPNDSSVSKVFEELVNEYPLQVALRYKEDRVTYGELNERANQLAHYLKEQGIISGDYVGIALERSVDLYVSILAVLKAGAVYVPLDKDYPEERLRYLVQDSGVSILITKEATEGIKFAYNERTIFIDLLTTHLSAYPKTNLSNEDNGDIAYLMYTSGSTGRPKGVEVKHRGILRLVKNNAYVKWGRDRVFLQLAPIAFDASTFEIWGSLLNGGELVIMPPGTPTIDQISNHLKQYGVTTLWLTSGLFSLFVDNDIEGLRGVDQLLVGGDVVSVPHVKKVLNFGGVEVINGYGPTENTTFTCCYSVPSSWQGASLPIGRPIANTEVYILDSRMRMVPIGVAGELYIGGDGLAAGYHNRSDLTDMNFVSNPYSSDLTSKLYKTGDQVRYLPDGNIEFLGRFDQQVKIRGHRIELGEIEYALGQHEYVKDSIVMVSESKQLVAYIVLQSESIVSNSEFWRAHLHERLPEYMIPAAFIVMDSFPLTPNGKLDRKALPAPDYAIQSNDYISPVSEIEILLAGIWQDVLKVEKVGINDHFFELGGDSIHAIQVAARLHKLKMRLAIQDLFQHPRISQLVPYISSDIVTANQGAVEGKIELTPIQKWFFKVQKENQNHFNQAMVLKRKEGWDLRQVQKTLRSLINHHDGLRTSYGQNEDGEYTGYNRGIDDSFISVPVFDFTPFNNPLMKMEEEATKLQKNLDIAKGKLISAGIFITEEESYLLIIIHHLVIDGVSWRILIDDFYHLYDANTSGSKYELPEKTTSFYDWSQALYEYAQRDILREELPFWEKMTCFKGTKLPVDQMGSSSYTMHDYRSIDLVINEESTRMLLTEVHKTYHTQINDILLSALVLTIGEWTNNNRVAVELEGHGREVSNLAVDLNRTIGWFTSLYPVIFDHHDSEISAVVKNVKETLRQVPNKGFDYGILKYLSKTNSALLQDNAEEPELTFNYLGQFDQDLADGFVNSSVPVGELSALETKSNRKLEINAIVTGGKFTFSFGYNSLLYNRETIENLVMRFENHLYNCIRHCTSAKEEWTPSDFDISSLSINELETIQETWQPENIKSISYLAPMQEGMLFQHLREPKSPIYFEQIDFTLHGKVDTAAFKKSFNDLINKHEVLRTVFLYESLHRPIQLVQKEVKNSNVYYVDYSEHAYTDACTLLEEYKQSEKKNGMNLAEGNLFRFGLIQTSPDEFHWIWNFHHILMDGWCLGLVMDDFLSFYNGHLHGQSVPALQVNSYRKYIDWLEKQNRKKAGDFWTDYLNDFDQVTGIPRSENHTKRNIEAIEHTMSKELTAKLYHFAKDCQVTMNTVFRCVWGIMLQRYNDTDDVVFGCVTSGRSVPIQDVENIIGLFINSIPVRVHASSNSSFMSLLSQLQYDASQAEPFSYLSLSEIQGSSLVKGNLFDHIIAFENYPLDTDDIERKSESLGFSIKDTLTSGETNYDLDVLVLPGTETAIRVSYNTSMYSRHFLQQMFRHLEQIISQVIVNPEISLKDIEIVDEKEKARFQELNNTNTLYPRDQLIHKQFEEQVRKVPDAIAVVYGEKKLTYSELNREANRIAHLLRQEKTGPETIIGIMVKPSVEMMIGILGVLKSGGAYIPIDPEYPEDRIEYMLQDSNAKGLLIQRDIQIPNGYNGKWWTFDGEEVHKQPCHDPEIINEVNDLAYVVYTSGSTGLPKGVMVEHCSLSNLVHWHNRSFELQSIDRCTKYAGFSFDATAWEVFPTILGGAQLHIIKEEIRLDVQLLNQYFENAGITISFLPTQLAEQFMELNNNSLRILHTGGERVQRIPHTRYQFVNNYGPSENTICATSYRVLKEDKQPPIGSPIDNNRIYIMDRNLRLQPFGVVGEICIAGDSLARGYLNQPELTSQKFVVHPYEPNQRLYRTGDLGKWSEDGFLEYVGRNDDQVKIRGYRIELGEIENSLLQNENVSEAVVLAKKQETGQMVLCAYVTKKNKVDHMNLREYLSQTLPDFMIPAHFVILDTFPLTRNGKVDRKALPQPLMDDPHSYKEPTNEKERLMCEVWQEVLHLECIGIEDNFFTLGGDSIKAIQVASRLHKHQLRLEVNHLFQHPTIAELVYYVRPLQLTQEQGEIKGEVLLTPIQHWFFEQSFPNPHHFNQASILFEREGYEAEYVRQVLDRLIEHHDALRMRYSSTGKQENRAMNTSAYQLNIFDLRYEQDVRRKIEEEANKLHQNLNIYEGPLVQAGLFQHPEGDYLLLVIHHLIVDGVSWRILLEDFSTAYTQLVNNQAIAMPFKTTSFQAWAKGLSQYAQSAVLQKELSYWREIVEEQKWIPPINGNEMATYEVQQGATFEFILGQKETRDLLMDSHLAYKTEVNDLLLTALILAVRDWSRHEKVSISLEAHGREEIIKGMDLTRTIGWFTTIYPVVFHTDTREISQAIKYVKETIRKIPNKGIGYGILKYLTPALQEEYKEPEISFNYLGQFETGQEGVLGQSSLPTGQAVSPSTLVSQLLAINGVVVHGQLKMMFSFDPLRLEADTVQGLINQYKQYLMKVIEHCITREEIEFTPSDFSMEDLSIEELDDIFELLGGKV